MCYVCMRYVLMKNNTHTLKHTHIHTHNHHTFYSSLTGGAAASRRTKANAARTSSMEFSTSGSRASWSRGSSQPSPMAPTTPAFGGAYRFLCCIVLYLFMCFQVLCHSVALHMTKTKVGTQAEAPLSLCLWLLQHLRLVVSENDTIDHGLFKLPNSMSVMLISHTYTHKCAWGARRFSKHPRALPITAHTHTQEVRVGG